MLKNYGRLIFIMSVIIAFFVLSCLKSYADGTHPQGIRLDGTVGTAGRIDLPGPNYAIKPEYGKQAGANLFHSFQQFNIHSGESATFSGPASVKNIISRVTGGSASWIDGKLSSTIPGADLYFLNPAGVMFGSNAALDLSGSFHVSTADYLKMGDNERFYSTPIENEVLSVVAPKDFGFLSDTPAKISVDGANLQVGKEKNIYLIGGDIEITHNAYLIGQIISVEGKKNVSIDESSIFVNGGGSLFIRCGQFLAKDSDIQTDTFDEKDGGSVDIQADTISFTDGSYIDSSTYGKGKGGNVSLKATGSVSFSGENSKGIESSIEITAGKGKVSGNAGNLTIDAENISFTDGAYISVSTWGTGKGGYLNLKAGKSVFFTGESRRAEAGGIWIGTYLTEEGAGAGGTLTVESENVSFTGGAVIYSNTLGKGKGGEVTLKASETVSFAGEDSKAAVSRILIGTSFQEEGAGDAGKLLIDAKNISFMNGAGINSNTEGKGKGGEVTLKAAESVSFAGESSKAGISGISGIWISTEEAGDAGKLTIDAKNISFADGAYIISGTFSGKGKGGEVTLNAAETITLSGVSSEGNRSFVDASSYNIYGIIGNTGPGGKISVSAQKLSISDKGKITTSSEGEGGGQAGDISLNASKLEMSGGTSISSNATFSGGGRISVDAKDTVHLTDSSITTNVAQGSGRGGDITIGNPDTGTGSRFVILNRSHIQANAQDGDGGAVFIQTENFLKSADSKVTATSERGNQGTVKIDAPDLDISSGLTILSGNFFDAIRWASTPCEARSSDEPESRFEVRIHIAHPVPFGD